MMFRTTLYLLALTGATLNLAHAHPGGVDKNGGHTNKANSEYHCHKEPCFSNQQQVQEAHQQAVGDGEQFSELYERSDWPHWVDYDRDCQDARAEALIAASTKPVKFKRNKGCVVSHGEWFAPYTNQTFTEATKLDIDHIVPLKEAHVSGGHAWTRKQRRAFANDPENLLVVSASENREKGAKYPAEWVPDTTGYRCEYIALWLHVKAKYELAIDAKEQQVIDDYTRKCN